MASTVARIELDDGRVATVSFLDRKDSAKELLDYINAFIEEGAYLLEDKKFTLKQEEGWTKAELEKFRKKEGYNLIVRIDGKIIASSGGFRERGKGRNNVCIGIIVSKPFRRLGLGEALLRLNIKTAKKLLNPRNIYLSVLAPNKPAHRLYTKIGFKEFAVYKKWLLHKGKYIDQIFMKL